MSTNKKLQKTALSFKTAKDLLNLNSPIKKSIVNSETPAKNNIQQRLIEIYREIVNDPNIGITHDFFKVGGNSLKAVYLISSVQKAFNIHLSLIDVFKNPTIEELAQIISDRRPSEDNDIYPLSKQEYYPASPAQKRMWILDHFDQDHIAYNMPDAFRIKGVLNMEALESAFLKLIEQHEILRTNFVDIQGELMQKIGHAHSSLYKFDFIDLTKDERATQSLEDLILLEVKTPFDLTNGSLIRTKLIEIDRHNYVFLLNLHHIVADGWSMNILLKQLFEFYSSYCDGIKPDVKPQAVQYKDYVNWYYKLLSSSRLKANKEYWVNKFSGNLPVIDLTEKPRPKDKDFRGNTIVFEIGEKLTESLKALNHQHGMTMFMTLQAFVNILINKYSGEDDIIVGTPISGRIHRDLENQIGLYLNNLVLRSRVNDSLNFLQFMEQIKITNLEAYEHQDYPYDRLIDDLNLKQEGRNPLYDIMVVMETNELNSTYKNPHYPSLENLTIESIELPNPVSKLDLTFFFRVEDKVRISVEYNSSLFDEEQIKSMNNDFVGLIESYFKTPYLSIAGLKNSLMNDDERIKQRELETSLIGEFKQDF